MYRETRDYPSATPFPFFVVAEVHVLTEATLALPIGPCSAETHLRLRQQMVKIPRSTRQTLTLSVAPNSGSTFAVCLWPGTRRRNIFAVCPA